MRVTLRIASAVPSLTDVAAGALLVQSQGNLSYYANGDSFYMLVSSGGVMHSDCANQTISAHITASVLADAALLDDLLLSAVAPILRRRALFPLHAFAAAWQGQGALLVGASGCGKTTAGLALVRGGWTYLADDRPSLRRHVSGSGSGSGPVPRSSAGPVPRSSAGIDILCWHDPVNVTRATALLFPELQAVFADDSDILKSTCIVEQIYGPVLATQAQAALLVFPSIASEERSTVTRLAAGDALAQLLPQSLDAWDKAVVNEHFTLLASLVERAPAYRLRLGRDLDHLPDLLASLL